jgi:hypothetical protein
VAPLDRLDCYVFYSASHPTTLLGPLEGTQSLASTQEGDGTKKTSDLDLIPGL